MAKKRYLVMPEAVTVKNNDGTAVHDTEPCRPGENPKDLGEAAPVTMGDWIRRAVLEVNPDFWENYAAISISNNLRAAFSVSTKSVVELDEDDWKFLDEAIQKPKFQYRDGTRSGFGYYRPDLMWQFQCFMDAVHGASPVKPNA